MSVTVRTNRALDQVAANTTNWVSVPGTSGTAALTHQSGSTGFDLDVLNNGGWNRVQWTVATTTVSGGISYNQLSGLSASTQYTHSMWVRSNRTGQKLALTVTYKNSTGTVVGSATTGAIVTNVPGTWQLLTVTATSGLAVTQCTLTAGSATGGVVWSVTSNIEVCAVQIETGPTATQWFTGSLPDSAGTDYGWTGTPNASPATATLYTPVLALVPFTTMDPTPRVEITLSDLWPGTSTVNVWRTSESTRVGVRSGRDRVVIGSDFLTDYEPPLGRAVSYELEILDGLNSLNAPDPVSVTVNAPYGVIQDPLVPASSVSVQARGKSATGSPTLVNTALDSLERAMEVNKFTILGNPDPVALIGQRMAASGVPFDVLTDAAEQGAALRDLLNSAGVVLVRPLPSWGDSLPALCYTVVPKVREVPVDVENGGTAIRWNLVGDFVAGPTMDVLVAVWTYGDVELLWSTYQAAQTAFAGKTYLDTLKDPTG